MAVAKQVDQPAPLTPLVLLITAVATSLAVWLQYPAVIVTFVGMLVAGFMSKPPTLTGQKDKDGYPTVGNPGESKRLAQHRFWSQLRTKLFQPTLPWPTSFAQVAALGAACVAFTLPYEGAYRPLSMIEAGAALPVLPWLNAVCAYLLVAQVAEVKRVTASDRDLKPVTNVTDWVSRVGKDQKATSAVAGAIVGAGGIAVVTWWWVESADWYYVQPAWLIGVGAFLIIASAIGHKVVKEEAYLKWEQTMEARAVWEARFAALGPTKLGYPTLISHTRYGDEGEGWVDLFEAPAAEGVKKWVPTPDNIPNCLPANHSAVFLSAPDLDENGKPITPSRSPLRFRAVVWNNARTPNLLDPAVDREVLGAWLEAVVADACVSFGNEYQVIPLTPPTPLFVEKDNYREGETAAWKVQYGLTGSAATRLPESLVAMTEVVQGALGDVEVYAFGDELYIGAITAETTTLSDKTIFERLQTEMDIQTWNTRWRDLTGIQPPTYFPHLDNTFDVPTRVAARGYASAKKPDKQVIHFRVFGAPQGLTAEHYFAKASLEGLRSAIPGSQWVALGRYKNPRDLNWNPQFFSLSWSQDPLPLNPAEIIPGPGGAQLEQATEILLVGAISHAFTAAKLAIPYFKSATALTSHESRKHIWDISLTLIKGVTLAQVKKVQEQLRLAMGGCEWIRVTASSDGCRIVAGASANEWKSVNFKASTARFIATALDWEQAFTDTKLENSNGRVPELKSMEPLPKNDLVQKLVFTLPPGLAIGNLRDKRSQLSAATNNAFLDIQAGSSASEIVIMVAQESPMPDIAPFDWQMIAESDAIPFATDIYGEPVVFNPQTTPHLLLLGDAGTGKSASLQAILTPAIIRGWEIHILDSMKGAADFTYAFPYAKTVATDTLTVTEALKRIYSEVERRKDLNRKHGTGNVTAIRGEDRVPHLMVFIDELLSAITPDPLMKLSGDESEEELRDHAEKTQLNQAKRQMGVILGKIAREARSAGVTIVAATQSLTKEETNQTPGVFDVKRQSARVLLGKTGWAQKAGAFKNPESAPDLGEVVPRGRGVFESAEGAPFAFQTWFAGDPDHDGDDAGLVHVNTMLEHIAAVRSPEPARFTDDDLRLKLETVKVFGEIVGGEAESSEEVDLGELDLDFSDFELFADEEASVSEGVGETSDVTDAAATEPGTDSIDEARPAVEELSAGTSERTVLILPTGVIIGVGDESVECEYGQDRYDRAQHRALEQLGSVVLLSDDDMLAEALGCEQHPLPLGAGEEQVAAAVAAWVKASGYISDVTVVVPNPAAEDELGVILQDYLNAAGVDATVQGPVTPHRMNPDPGGAETHLSAAPEPVAEAVSAAEEIAPELLEQAAPAMEQPQPAELTPVPAPTQPPAPPPAPAPVVNLFDEDPKPAVVTPTLFDTPKRQAPLMLDLFD